MFPWYALPLASLLSSVVALPLASRDVVDPPITSPTASTVWHVGEIQTVTWSTANLPANQTNPVGRLVLGYLYNNSENLMLDSPLATNLNYSVGQAQITVPDVPTRTDYIVVLFGDSGNASPKFTIINDASSSGSSTSVAPTAAPTNAPGSPDSSSGASTPASTPPPANSNSPGDSGGSPSTATSGSPQNAVSPTTAASSTSSTSTGSHSSTVVSVTVSATPSSTQSSAAWQNHAPNLGACLSVTLAFIYFAFS